MDQGTMINAMHSVGQEVASCQRSGHPLELIPFFRRFKPSLVRDGLYTLAFNMLFVVAFTAFALLFDPEASLRRVFWINFVIANCIGSLLHAAFDVGHRLLGDSLHKQSFALRAMYYSAVSVACVFGGYWLAFTLLNLGTARNWVFSAQGAITILFLSLMISGVLATIFYARERQARDEAAFQRERARVAAAERSAKVAELKLLEAQVEPHFLYNTLANVISLIDTNAPIAKHMVERLIEYLRHAATAAAGADVTLGRQIELLRAYLDLIALRMGPRLTYRIDVPAELKTLPLPPMLLQPLVENAIKHGIEPAVQGGEVVVSARLVGDRVVLAVADNGIGVSTVQPKGSTGLGLANLRDRLGALYGPLARLTIEDKEPGTKVTITLPAGAAV